MKKTVILSALVFVLSLSFAYAPVENKNNSFSSTDEEVAMKVVRGTGEVKLSIQVRDIAQFDHIVIERSAETPNYFGKCKYISVADLKTADGQLVQLDKYPYSATKDVYYRIKTVTKDGVERAYPAVLLAASAQ